MPGDGRIFNTLPLDPHGREREVARRDRDARRLDLAEQRSVDAAVRRRVGREPALPPS